MSGVSVIASLIAAALFAASVVAGAAALRPGVGAPADLPPGIGASALLGLAILVGQALHLAFATRLALELAGSPGTSLLAETVRRGTDWAVRPIRAALGPRGLVALLVAAACVTVLAERALALRLGLDVPHAGPGLTVVVARIAAELALAAWMVTAGFLAVDAWRTVARRRRARAPLDPDASGADLDRVRNLLTFRAGEGSTGARLVANALAAGAVWLVLLATLDVVRFAGS